MIKGAPFISSDTQSIQDILTLCDIQPDQKAVDLGSGDGRIVIALAQAGAQAHGYEMNFFVYLLSLWRIYRSGLWGKAHIHFQDFWKADLQHFDIVVVFGMPHLMNRLEKKLSQELLTNSKVLSNYFDFPTWQKTSQLRRISLSIKQ